MSKKTNAVQVMDINGSLVLGTIKGNKVRGIASPTLPTRQTFANYIKASATGDLSTIKVGAKKDITTYPLTPVQELEFARVLGLWVIAEAQSAAWVTSKVFDELLGK